MSAIEALRTKFRTAAESAGFNTYRLGWITEIPTGTSYPLFLQNPQSGTKSSPTALDRKWKVRYFLIALDRNSSGAMCNEEERAAKWGELEAMNADVLASIASDTSAFQVDGEVSYTYDAGGNDGLLPDQVIWIEVSLTIKAADCD